MKKSKKKGGRATPPASSRYTPPQPRSYKKSSRWVPFAMFGSFGLGCLIIILNYFPDAPLLPGDPSNRNLFIGLGFITLGFIFSAKYR